MSLTILDVLRNAKHNIVTSPTEIGITFGKEQLANAVTLLEADYDLYADFDESWAKHEEAPDA